MLLELDWLYLDAFGASSNESEHWRMVAFLGFGKVCLDESQFPVGDGFYGGADVERLHGKPRHVALVSGVLQNNKARIRFNSRTARSGNSQRIYRLAQKNRGHPI